MAATGNNTPARFTLFECSIIERPTGRRFATINFKVGGLGSFLNLAGADARRANPDLLPHARHDRAHALQVWIPPAPPGVVCVADYVSVMRPFAAEITLQCHFSSRLIFYLSLDSLLRKVAKPSSLF
jgi:hypothetical protein